MLHADAPPYRRRWQSGMPHPALTQAWAHMGLSLAPGPGPGPGPGPEPGPGAGPGPSLSTADLTKTVSWTKQHTIHIEMCSFTSFFLFVIEFLKKYNIPS